jgi:hypothetical protein
VYGLSSGIKARAPSSPTATIFTEPSGNLFRMRKVDAFIGRPFLPKRRPLIIPLSTGVGVGASQLPRLFVALVSAIPSTKYKAGSS